MPKIVKLSDLSKKERKKILQDTQNEVNERKAKIESNISFKSKKDNKTTNINNRILLPTNNNLNSSRIGRYSSNTSFPMVNNTTRENIENIQKNNSNNFFNATDNTKKTKSVGLPIISNKRNLSDNIRTALSVGTGIKYGETAGNVVNNILGTTQNFVSSAKTGLMQFGKVLNERLVDKQNNDIKLTESLANISMKYGDKSEKEKAKNLLKGQAKLNGLKYDENTNKISEIKYEDVNKKLQEKIDKENKDMQTRVEESTGIGKVTTELASSLGNNLVGAGASLVNPALGISYFTGSATGSYEDDARERGITGDKAKLYAGLMGTFEGAGDYIFGFGSLSKGLSLAKKTTAGAAVKKFGETLLGNGLENAFQEGITEPINELVAYVTGGKESAQTEDLAKRIFKSASYGFLSGAIFNGIGRGISSIKNLQNKINNKESIKESDIKQVISDLEDSGMSREEIFKEMQTSALEAAKSEVQRSQESILEQSKAKENLVQEINNSNLSDTDKTQMLDYLNNNEITQADYNAMRETIDNSKIANGIENNQEILYNNGESEGDLNDRYKRSIVERRNGLYEEPKKNNKNREYNWQEYNNWEQSIKTIPEGNLTNKEKTLIRKAKIEHNKDIFLYDENDNDNVYSGGVSQNTKNKIIISRQKAETFGLVNMINHEIVESDILHNEKARDILVPVIDLIKKDSNFKLQKDEFWESQEGNMPSDNLIAKDIICDRFSEIISKEKLDYDIILNNITNSTIDMALNNYYKQVYGKELEKSSSFIMPTAENTKKEVNLPVKNTENNIQNKKLNPSEISNMNKESASTTPKLKKKNYEKGNNQSNFISNILNDSKFLNEDLRQEMAKEDNIKYYKGITNSETLEKAYNSLKNGGEKETLNWFNKNEKNTTAEDVTKGWILLKQYQDAGDYQGAVEVAKKMRQMGTNAGQTVQAYNILSRLTPEGMFYYAQSELDEAYNKMIQGKSKEWIEENQDKFNLTPEETQTILDIMKEISNMEDGREKTIRLAEIQKLVSNKIPPTKGQSVKAWMRISMLFNPKTQVRNVMGNAVVLPVNMTSDIFAGAIDKIVSKKTGIRTTGITKEGIKGYAKGFGKGLFESYDDFRKGVNTREVTGNRFEIGEGRSFKNKRIGKAFNIVDNILSFALDAGDRGFYEATFTNSLNNQMILNNSTEVTQDMIDIATNEALQRTWQDDNAYTKAVLMARNALNGKIGNSKGLNYGLGDILIPFAKTPANLTKAIVDYSPVGLTKTLAIDARKFKNSLSNGQYSAQLQHKFVQNLGKGMAGSLLYVLGYGLAKAGIASGEADDDKDVKNFMKDSLGISSYSINIGGKSFSYDWAQPVATPLAIMTNYVKYSKDNLESVKNIIGNFIY